MTPRIWKFKVMAGDTNPHHHYMPEGAEILAVQAQRGEGCIWALVNPLAPTQRRSFHIYGTGFDIDPSHKYVGTYQSGPYVWHVFEE